MSTPPAVTCNLKACFGSEFLISADIAMKTGITDTGKKRICRVWAAMRLEKDLVRTVFFIQVSLNALAIIDGHMKNARALVVLENVVVNLHKMESDAIYTRLHAVIIPSNLARIISLCFDKV